MRLDEIIPETILLDAEVLGRLHLTLAQVKGQAAKGTFPPILKLARGTYAVKPEDLESWHLGRWISADSSARARRRIKRVIRPPAGRTRRPRFSSEGLSD